MPHFTTAWAAATLAALLLAAGYTDVRYGKIYNFLTYPAAAIGLIGHTLAGGLGGDGSLPGLSGSLTGLAVAFLPMLLAWLAGGVRAGDLKLMGAIGCLLADWRLALAAMFYGFLVAMVISLVVMIRKRILWSTLGRIGRFMYLMFTPAKASGGLTTPQSPTIPLGAAMCVGTVLAVVEGVIHKGLAAKLLLGI